VEHGLCRVEFGDRWKDTTGIASKQDDVGWVILRDARNLGVVNILNGVGTIRGISQEVTRLLDLDSPSGVLSEGGVVIVDETGLGVENHILQNGAKLDGVVNIRFLLTGETNALCVALQLLVQGPHLKMAVRTYSAFNVEDTSVTPAVLIVTNQGTVWIGGKSGLASS
jgi:hypothetical protein